MWSELPRDWKLSRIGDFAWETSKRTNTGKENVYSITKHRGFVPSLDFFGKRVFSKNLKNYKIVQLGQFAYATIHLDEGSIDCFQASDNGIISPMYTVFDTNNKVVDQRFLLSLLRTPMMRNRYIAIGQGSINRRKSISFDILAAEFIPLPPLTEQRKIAEILSSVDEAIQATQAVIEQTRRVKEGLLQELLTKGIGHTRFKETPIGEMPEGWEIAKICDLCSFSSGFGFKTHDWSEKGLPIIRIQNLNGSSKFNYYKGLIHEKWLVHPGELLFAWAGTAGASFGPCIWPGPIGVLNQHIYKLNPCESVNRNWLYEVMKLITSKIERQAHGFKTTLLHVHKSDITDQLIPLPPSIEQETIATHATQLEEASSANINELEKLRDIKAGLLQDLLTGKVRVSV